MDKDINFYKNPETSLEERLEDLLARMTLDEKIGQMTQVEKNSLTPDDVRQYAIGSVLSGGGGNPARNTPADWAAMVSSFQQGARQSRLGIPLLYGVDAVHGHSNVYGATIFPHNIGLGAAGDPDLVERIARATALELVATGVTWNFAPTVAVPQDPRWGRFYEGYAQDPQLVAQLGEAYIRGSQGDRLNDPFSVLANPKHYLADGAAEWGTSRMRFPIPPDYDYPGDDGMFAFTIDQGNTQIDEETLRNVHLAPYRAALAAGAQIVMASFSSWQGNKLHGHHYLLTEVLKGELGFEGFIISDWAGMDQLDPDYDKAVVKAVNAGVDMCMVPWDFRRFITAMNRAVEQGNISLARVDNAVRRILRVKLAVGVFERLHPQPAWLENVGSLAHRSLAREAVSRSLVLLKKDGQTLPLAKSTPTILVGGQAADDIGLQCGGWTIEWLGKPGPITVGDSLLDSLKAAVSRTSRVVYDPSGAFEDLDLPQAEVGIAVIAEPPYAEGFGDREDLTLPAEDVALLERMRKHCQRLVVVLYSGRPLVLTEQLPLMDALVAAWLPGSEGRGIADVLFGDRPFTGKLRYNWPRDMEQVRQPGSGAPLFSTGFGLT